MLRPFLRDRRRRWALATALFLAGVAFLYAVRAVLPPFLLAAFLAYAVYPAVDALHRRGLGRAWAILLVYALGGLLAVGLLAFVMPAFLGELSGLSGTIPGQVSRIGAALSHLERRYDRLSLPPVLRQALDDSVGHLQGRLLAAVGGAVHALLGLFGQAFNLILAPIVAFYLLLDLPRFRRQVELWLPAPSRAQARTLLREMDRALAGFIRGQLIVSAAVGLLTTLGLALVGVPFPLVLGLIAAVTNLIPYFGPFLGAVPGLLLAATASLGLTVRAGLVYLVVQQLEAAILVPRVMGETVGLHPLALIFALLVGGTSFGLAGLVLAVPAAGVLRVLASFVLRWLADEPLPGDERAGG